MTKKKKTIKQSSPLGGKVHKLKHLVSPNFLSILLETLLFTFLSNLNCNYYPHLSETNSIANLLRLRAVEGKRTRPGQFLNPLLHEDQVRQGCFSHLHSLLNLEPELGSSPSGLIYDGWRHVTLILSLHASGGWEEGQGS